MDIESVSPLELLSELAAGNPAPEEKWSRRDDFDPTFGAKELRASASKGWIELDASGTPEAWRFRLTVKGRAEIAKASA